LLAQFRFMPAACTVLGQSTVAQPATNSHSWNDSGDNRTADVELVALALNGRQDAFEALFDRYARQVYTIAYRISGNATEAEDLTQDIFLRAFRTLGGLRQPQAFAAWLYQLATNVCLDALRRRRVPQAELSEAVIATYPDESRWRAPETAAVAGDDRRAVWETLGRLAPSQRAALTLRELHGMTYGEIAETLGTSVGAVEVLVFRARRRFREQYEKVAAGAGAGPTERAPRCKDVRASLAAVLDDEESDGKTRAAALAHVRGCAACQTEIAALRRDNRARALLPLLPLPVALKGHVIIHLGALIGTSVSGTGAAATASTGAMASGATGSGATAAVAGGSTGMATTGGGAEATALGAKAAMLGGTKAILIAVVATTATVASMAVPLRRHDAAVTRQAAAGRVTAATRHLPVVLTPSPNVVMSRLAVLFHGAGQSGGHNGAAASAAPAAPRAATSVTHTSYALPHQPPILPASAPPRAPAAVVHSPKPRSTRSLHPTYRARRATPFKRRPTRVAPHATSHPVTASHPIHTQPHRSATTRRKVQSHHRTIHRQVRSYHHTTRRYYRARRTVRYNAARMPLAVFWPSGHLLHFDRREVLRLRTISDASVVVTLQIIGPADPHSLGRQSLRMYRFTLYARANGRGDASVPLRYAYVPTRPVPVTLTVTVHAGHLTTRRSAAMTLVRR